MRNPFQRLFDSFRSTRKLLDTIAEQNRIHDEVLAAKDSALEWAKEFQRQSAVAHGELQDTKVQLEAVQEHLKAVLLEGGALADENARLKTRDAAMNVSLAALDAELATAKATLDHAQHCYEQCEADRQALAKERDEAKAERDKAAKETLLFRDQRDAHWYELTTTAERLAKHIEEVNARKAEPTPIRCPSCFGEGCEWCEKWNKPSAIPGVVPGVHKSPLGDD